MFGCIITRFLPMGGDTFAKAAVFDDVASHVLDLTL